MLGSQFDFSVLRLQSIDPDWKKLFREALLGLDPQQLETGFLKDLLEFAVGSVAQRRTSEIKPSLKNHG